ncbi:N-acetylglucosamine kinase [Ferdinandcohnia quinoae]|uniref:ATPase BadF/BadG/BcrA/BcrD type domain-containing protein n=1 Tax=Fredinandcohnia quinoae TaxID=2918902 RepID=A0AAW5E7E9_9BACI|nr:BadF/BadG/BcrA/BcrD ATPase family protein [Fredinandcohnia sp. SECRCQ15]MCH1625947.1 hypothetical protein [Fredinandcohnia sp. SECRCQ15]
MYVLGIDGGGTKTKGVIADHLGNVYASKTVGATNQNGVDIHTVESELSNLFTSLKSQNREVFSKLHTIFAGMSGVDRPEAKEAMKEILLNLAPSHVNIMIDNDGINALYSGTLGAPGIVQIAGTGSITFGMNRNGERKRIGGWGYLIDDEGSGYDIGRSALHAVFKAFDGRGPKTVLTEMIHQHFNVSVTPGLIQYIYEPGKSRSVIAPLSKYVSEAVDKNDEVAKEIISNASGKLANSIGSLCGQLFKNDKNEQPIPVVLVGGVFNRDDLFLRKIHENVKMNVRLIKPELEPVDGAVIAALKHANKEIDLIFLENMKRV